MPEIPVVVLAQRGQQIAKLDTDAFGGGAKARPTDKRMLTLPSSWRGFSILPPTTFVIYPLTSSGIQRNTVRIVI